MREARLSRSRYALGSDFITRPLPFISKMVTIARLLPKYCSCMTLMGREQREYEESVGSGVKIADAMNEFGWIKMCCRRSVFTVADYFIRSANEGAYTDETGLTTGSPNYDISKAIMRSSPPVIPKRKVAPFPPLPGLETPMSPKRILPPVEAVPVLGVAGALPLLPLAGAVPAVAPPTPKVVAIGMPVARPSGASPPLRAPPSARPGGMAPPSARPALLPGAGGPASVPLPFSMGAVVSVSAKKPAPRGAGIGLPVRRQ